MTKAKEVVAYGETPATSAKINQIITDYLTRGTIMCNAQGGPLTSADNGTWIVGWYPYNPDKQLWDRLRIFGQIDYAAAVFTTQYSVDSGGSWSTIIGGAPPVATSTPSSGSTTQFDTTVDLSGIGSFQWLGIRLNFTVSSGSLYWFVHSHLFNATDTPY